jgi:hypothetical protein
MTLNDFADLILLYVIAIPIYFRSAALSLEYYVIKANVSQERLQTFIDETAFPLSMLFTQNGLILTFFLHLENTSGLMSHFRKVENFQLNRRVVSIVTSVVFPSVALLAFLQFGHIVRLAIALVLFIQAVIVLRFGHKLLN